jgi:tetrathionate reductase subunit B
MKVFVIDLARCNGCYSCQVACKDEHAGNDWPPYAKPQPDTGQFWLKIKESVRGTVPKVRVSYQPVLCAHCANAPCLAACPAKDAIYQREDGLIIIDAEKCTGCRNCLEACPYNAIYFNENLNIAQKCTGCAHLIDRGWTVPRCVDACPTECIRFGEESELKALTKKGKDMYPEAKTRPRLRYLNIPGRFIAGTVYDPAVKETVAGANCTLTAGNRQTYITTTDAFGDFWFENLTEGEYTLEIKKGSKTTTIPHIQTSWDINLGDIPLT